MENSSSGSRQSRDAGFQRSQRRPDTNATESDTRLKETFEQAIANRFGEEIGVDLHDVARLGDERAHAALYDHD